MRSHLILYLAGPMTGIPQFNFPLFHEVAYALRSQDHIVWNPAEHDLESTPAIVYEPGYERGDVSATALFDSRVAFRWDFTKIIESHAIALLPGWERSSGATAERLVAEKCGKLVLLLHHCRIDGDPAVWTLTPDSQQRRMRAEVQ